MKNSTDTLQVRHHLGVRIGLLILMGLGVLFILTGSGWLVVVVNGLVIGR